MFCQPLQQTAHIYLVLIDKFLALIGRRKEVSVVEFPVDINRYPQFSWPLRSLSEPLHSTLNRKLIQHCTFQEQTSIKPTIVNKNNNEDGRLGLEALGAVLKVSHFVCVWYFDNVALSQEQVQNL